MVCEEDMPSVDEGYQCGEETIASGTHYLCLQPGTPSSWDVMVIYRHAALLGLSARRLLSAPHLHPVVSLVEPRCCPIVHDACDHVTVGELSR